MSPAPGPWKLRMEKSTWDPAAPDYPVAVEDANGEKVVFACVTVTSPKNIVALDNTRLAAAAPGMLALLQKMRGHLHAQWKNEINAVISELPSERTERG